MAFLSTLLTPVSTVIQGFYSLVTNTLYLSNQLFVKNSPGTLYTLTGFTSANINQYLQLYNTNTGTPPSNTSPLAVFILPQASNFMLNFDTGIPFSTGILACLSMSPTTYTSAGNNTYFTAVYK